MYGIMLKVTSGGYGLKSRILYLEIICSSMQRCNNKTPTSPQLLPVVEPCNSQKYTYRKNIPPYVFMYDRTPIIPP